MTFIFGLILVSNYCGVSTTESTSPPWEDPGNGGTPYGKKPIQTIPVIEPIVLENGDILLENLECGLVSTL
jgi:hypothetical protein